MIALFKESEGIKSRGGYYYDMHLGEFHSEVT